MPRSKFCNCRENLRLTSRQNFSSNFFKLIDLHHNLLKELSSEVDGLEVPYSNYTTSIKRDFFDDLAWRISTDYFEIILTDEEQKIEKKRWKGKKKQSEIVHVE